MKNLVRSLNPILNHNHLHARLSRSSLSPSYSSCWRNKTLQKAPTVKMSLWSSPYVTSVCSLLSPLTPSLTFSLTRNPVGNTLTLTDTHPHQQTYTCWNWHVHKHTQEHTWNKLRKYPGKKKHTPLLLIDKKCDMVCFWVQCSNADNVLASTSTWLRKIGYWNSHACSILVAQMHFGHRDTAGVAAPPCSFPWKA